MENLSCFLFLPEKKIDINEYFMYHVKWYCLPHESPGNSSDCQTFDIEIGGKK